MRSAARHVSIAVSARYVRLGRDRRARPQVDATDLRSWPRPLRVGCRSRSPAAHTSRTPTSSQLGRPAPVGCWCSQSRPEPWTSHGGPVLLQRRETIPGEDDALDRAAAAIVGSPTGWARDWRRPQRLNRRKLTSCLRMGRSAEVADRRLLAATLLRSTRWDSRRSPDLRARPRHHRRAGSMIHGSPRTRSTSRSADRQDPRLARASSHCSRRSECPPRTCSWAGTRWARSAESPARTR